MKEYLRLLTRNWHARVKDERLFNHKHSIIIDILKIPILGILASIDTNRYARSTTQHGKSLTMIQTRDIALLMQAESDKNNPDRKN